MLCTRRLSSPCREIPEHWRSSIQRYWTPEKAFRADKPNISASPHPAHWLLCSSAPMPRLWWKASWEVTPCRQKRSNPIDEKKAGVLKAQVLPQRHLPLLSNLLSYSFSYSHVACCLISLPFIKSYLLSKHPGRLHRSDLYKGTDLFNSSLVAGLQQADVLQGGKWEDRTTHDAY